MLWLAKRRYRVNLEQIEIDELDEICALDEDTSENVRAVYANHAIRRIQARFLVATRERPRLERLARRWDVDAPRMIDHGEAKEDVITQVRRGIREARWTFIERCAKTVIPILSLLVALVALLRK
jgi:protein-tyrosine-phosphatase